VADLQVLSGAICRFPRGRSADHGLSALPPSIASVAVFGTSFSRQANGHADLAIQLDLGISRRSA
jgi:hypothetical protein